MANGKHISIIGGGAAALFLAAQLAPRHEVHLYERGKMLGRKFLVAGKGGFNLTNSAEGKILLGAYPPHPILRQAIAQYDSVAFRAWLAELGIATYVGSSGRVFPTIGIKPIAVLQAILKRLEERGVHLHTHHEWKGMDAKGRLCFDHKGTTVTVVPDRVVLALGGASWAKTGSDGAWLSMVEALGVPTVPFAPSNCGAAVNWDADFATRFAGQPLKNIAVKALQHQAHGELLITQYGLEGNALYPIVPALRQALAQTKRAELQLNLKPYSSIENLQKKVHPSRTKTKNYAFTWNMSKAAVALAKQFTDKNTYTQPLEFAKAIQHLSIPIVALRPIQEAISTVGGIDFKGITTNFNLANHPHWHAIGEMLDWDAPTGGFLLQGCFSMASTCAAFLNQH